MQSNIYQHILNVQSEQEVQQLIQTSIALIYNPEYNVSFFGLQHLHPFDSAKYEKIIQYFTSKGWIKVPTAPQPKFKLNIKVPARIEERKCRVIVPIASPTQEQLQLIHSEEYLKSLHSGSTIGEICEFPPLAAFPSSMVYNTIVKPMLFQVSGTILAGRVALEKGVAINIGGGMHHAHATGGGGWCVFSDIYLSLTYLRQNFPERVKRAMVIDLDVHQGNGVERDKLGLNDKDTYMFDMFNPNIYPHDTEAMKAIDKRVDITPEVSEQYNELLKKALDGAFRTLGPGKGSDDSQTSSPVDIVFYNAGTDVLVGDPLNGGVEVTPDQVVERDEIVFRECRTRNIPVVMVLSGGYTKPLSSQTISRSIENLIKKGYFGELWMSDGYQAEKEKRTGDTTA